MEVVWEDDNFIVSERKGFHALISKRDFLEGEEVCKVIGKEITQPNRFSVQVGQNLHINVKAPVKYINHDCTGNIELQGRKFVAIKPIFKGDEIAFNYNSSEDELAEPFTCNKCGKLIKGRKFSEESKLV